MATKRPARKTSNLKNTHPLRSINDGGNAAPTDDTSPSAEEPSSTASGYSPPVAQEANSAPSEQQEKPRGAPPTIPHVLSKDTKRVGLYMSKEEHKVLTEARADDEIDANTRMRAMLALWRSNERFRRQIDRIAKNHPKGIQR